MEIQSFTIRHISNQVLSNTLTPDVARLIIGFLPLAPNQTNINGKKEGVWNKFRNNGQPMYEGCYNDGKKEGVWKGFYNRQLRYEHCYKDDKEDGGQKGWHYNRQLWYEHYYKDGEMDGVQKGW